MCLSWGFGVMAENTQNVNASSLASSGKAASVPAEGELLCQCTWAVLCERARQPFWSLSSCNANRTSGPCLVPVLLCFVHAALFCSIFNQVM